VVFERAHYLGRNRVGHHDVIQQVGTSEVIYDKTHPLVVGWVHVVKNPSNLHPNGLPATAYHLRQARNEPIVRAVSEVAIQSTLLCVNAQDVDILTTGTSRMGQQLRVWDK
jgi:hypothetical protein